MSRRAAGSGVQSVLVGMPKHYQLVQLLIEDVVFLIEVVKLIIEVGELLIEVEPVFGVFLGGCLYIVCGRGDALQRVM